MTPSRTKCPDPLKTQWIAPLAAFLETFSKVRFFCNGTALYWGLFCADRAEGSKATSQSALNPTSPCVSVAMFDRLSSENDTPSKCIILGVQK